MPRRNTTRCGGIRARADGRSIPHGGRNAGSRRGIRNHHGRTHGNRNARALPPCAACAARRRRFG